MSKTVIELQKAFQSLINSLKRNKKVLAVFAFGSIVSGDIWEESDIDLFIIYEDGFKTIRDVYSESLKVPVHSRILDKTAFLAMKDNLDIEVRNVLIASKLVFSRDVEISNIYNKVRYIDDKNVEKRNLEYLGDLLKDLGISKKYLQIDSLSTSYEVLIRALDSLSRLFINLKGYTVSKDSLTMAMNMDREFKEIVNNLFSYKLSKESIEETIKYIDKFIDINIIQASEVLIEYLKGQEEYVSAFDIINDSEFSEFNIKVERILKELSRRKVLFKKKRAFKDKNLSKILDENVYCLKR